MLLPRSVHQLVCQRQKKALTEWIFPKPTYPELPLDPGTAYAQLKRLLKEAGLPDIRFHDLRHTFASLLLTKDVPLINVSKFLGHSDLSTTANIYAHFDTESKQASADVMTDILTKKSNNV